MLVFRSMAGNVIRTRAILCPIFSSIFPQTGGWLDKSTCYRYWCHLWDFRINSLSKRQVGSPSAFLGRPSHSHLILVFLYSSISRICSRKISGTWLRGPGTAATPPPPSFTPAPWVPYWSLSTRLPWLEAELGPSQCPLCCSRWTLCLWPQLPSLTWWLCTASFSSRCPSACTTMSKRSGSLICHFARWWVPWCTSTCTWPSYSMWSRWWSGGSSSFSGRTRWSFTGSCTPLGRVLPCGFSSWSLGCRSSTSSMDAQARTVIQHASSSRESYSTRVWKPWTTP